jgi:hypothetical protein
MEYDISVGIKKERKKDKKVSNLSEHYSIASGKAGYAILSCPKILYIFIKWRRSLKSQKS